MAKRILIVEDEAKAAQSLQQRLQAAGYEVTLAADGVNGWQHAQRQPPDLAVVDLMMPDMDGWRFIQRLKGDERLKGIPVIILSALVDVEGPPRSFEQGDYFLAKPVIFDHLLKKIQELLGSTRERPRAPGPA
ncbi:MAG: hypothetical protein A3I71_07000 [Omnitrophica WOR_2 bacterium RIFCSPLOWO2_02_FULL_63_16]|nr:MAG: hypothetical protein A2Z92_03045 [Omnitrophica WOR_2 bacterium GWA2_63_20]OGX17163.1 MAG: hypothetical protein A2105_01110 [Omnitrophica WOR_2 bacterium GWF2_63_9]OGX34661.1 MAG: hypothetical protein A3B73_05935 [Omnitrophica WOR_2 bacterium RIFCSPHIGHO2_02_FULL_63_39]OGX44628.1 MAG: hypothetical protein A3I71_07000 [Omnitrophica WOR_2 bacterium RIFCSPLOWO2_02_FULL_63_16]OGX49198.1 MAG: hypothetical protein A3G88_04225 [Omnitrophica WOR_2 bacterium RIFCSPLOWO2_12_FULL_63_16]HAM41864.1 